MVMAKNRIEFDVAFLVVVMVMVGSVLLAIEGRPVKDGSRTLTQLRETSVVNGSVMSSVKPVESSIQDLSWLATVKQSGPSPGVGHHRAKGYKMFGRAKESGPSPGVGH
ncbi:Precursor of CEP16 [Cardamine amara subsp. amara]|uniref:Precursor of CEP16 n=1 Tax=Cardamine amara subsp. amara TaxID=228776 RepID=A0ABD1BPG1_CARAN